MQQLQLSQVKFNEEEIAEQEEELNEKISMLINIVAIDQITVTFFNHEDEPAMQPYRQFCSIMKNPIPVIKTNQIQTIERLAFCFYSMLVQSKPNNLAEIQMHFQGYLHHTTYVSVFVNFHEKVRSWCKQLLFDKNFTRSKQNLLAISLQIKEAKSKRLEILEWKITVCLILFEIIAGKNKIQRNSIIKLLKSFKILKKQNKISIIPILNAFKFMIRHFISTKNDVCMFFERQLKLWSQQIVDIQLIAQMKNMIYQCEQMSAEALRLTTNELIQQKPVIQRKANQSKGGHKIVMNTLNPHLFYQSNPTLITGRRLLRRRPSKEKQENFQKVIDHFFKTRPNNIDSKSLQSTPRHTSRTHLKVSIKISQKPSISLHSISRFTLDQANILKNTIKSHNQDKRSEVTFRQVSRVSLSASKSASSFLNKSGTRRRKQIYQKLIENEGSKKLVTNKHLTSEMLLLYEVEEQRCKITLEEILMGQFKKQQTDLNVKFIGVSEDNEFEDLNLSFFTIFNQQFAQIFFTIRKVGKQGYMLNCKTRSTYCKSPTIFQIEKKQLAYQDFTFDDLNESILKSVIYYQALQEKVQRTIGVSQVQAMEELLRQQLDIELSQSQLTKLLAIVDLFESYFFWYYTKGSYINGCRLEKRVSIDFEDLSAFAVSLGKFKSDYDSCLNQIVLVENINSLVETCIYLSYGRKIVHKAIRKIKDVYYLEVIQIADSVYRSFSRKDKIPYFKNIDLKRKLLKIDDFTSSQQKSKQIKEFQLKVHKMILNLKEILNEKDVFIFFMKNIVQNFIQAKYIHKLEKYLLTINKQQNFQVFDEKQINYLQKTKLDIVANSQQLNESKQIRPSIHSSIKHLRSILFKYCEVYELDLSFKIARKTNHLLKIENVIYTAKQIKLSNSIKILQIYKLHKRQNYSLLMYHQQPRPIAKINTGFHQRFVMIQGEKLIGNLIRRQKSQMYLSDDCTSVIKNVIKFGKGYCFINVSQCQSILCWRFDYYFPLLQAQYSTFLDEQIYLECLGQWSQNQQMWKHTIQKININLQEKWITLHNRRVRLFKSLKRLYFNEQQAAGILELIEFSGQLFYLITSFQQATLSIGKVENVMFLSNKLIYSSASPNKQKIGMYDNIMNYLYYKVLTGKLPSQVIAADYFLHEDDN